MLWLPCVFTIYGNYMRTHRFLKRVCIEPPCFPVRSRISSVHDNFGDEDGILRNILLRKSEDIPKQDPHDVSRYQTSLMGHQIRFVTSGKFRSSQWELTSRCMQNSARILFRGQWNDRLQTEESRPVN